ncbi:MAG: hypothetical protein K6A82_06455 [Prevotella sp.]|nr:hypothetical protein [Prevotella sp.]
MEVKHIYSFLILLSLLLAGCKDSPVNVVRSSQMPKLYPDYTGVTIPAEIAPLNFNYDGDCEAMDVTVRGSKGGELHVNGDYADFDIADWHALTKENRGGELSFTVTVKKNGAWTQYRDFKVYVSADPLGEWGLTYRLIPPGYEVYGKLGIYQRDLSSFNEEALLENSSVPGACLNCHTSNQTNPDQFTFHIRGEHGATLIQQKGDFELLKAKNDSIHGSMVYPYWHPTGKLIAYSTNKTHQSFHAVRSERIEVFDQASDILIYDPARHEIVLNPSLMTPDHYENYPVFSPDGRTLYFVSSHAWDIPAHYKQIQYNLCKVRFNPATGRIIGKVDTIVNARQMGLSANHPRPSYDGKFILFTMSHYGCFPIWHKEADQWLYDVRTGKARPLKEINSDDTDSYHNWSRNSRWIVFTSRRGNGYYTTLYLAHVNADGSMGKPFLLPQRNPWKYYDETLNSFNTPDFTLHPVSLDANKAARAIEREGRVETKVR